MGVTGSLCAPGWESPGPRVPQDGCHGVPEFPRMGVTRSFCAPGWESRDRVSPRKGISKGGVSRGP